MLFYTLLLSALSLVAAAPTYTPTVQLTYDPVYDVASNSLDIVACSNGANGLEHLGYSTFGDLPNFPYIGGMQAVVGWNSPECGTCWQLIYQNNTINVMAIDVAVVGFNTGLKAMNELTNGQAVELGNVQIVAKTLDRSVCGL